MERITLYLGCGPLTVTVGNEGLEGFPAENVIILMVTVTVRGPHPMYIHQSFLSATKVAQVANLRPLLSETPNPRKLGPMVIGSMGCFTDPYKWDILVL